MIILKNNPLWTFFPWGCRRVHGLGTTCFYDKPHNYRLNAKCTSFGLGHPRANQCSFQDLPGAMSKAKSDTESSQRALLKRLFPEVEVAAEQESCDHHKWMESFAEAAHTVTRYLMLTLLKDCDGQNSVFFSAKITSEASEASKEKGQLEKQVDHYKNILARTVRIDGTLKCSHNRSMRFSVIPQEEMLHTLQSKVEVEESKWKARLAEKDSQLEDVIKDRDSLERKNLALEESLKLVKQAEEVRSHVRTSICHCCPVEVRVQYLLTFARR